MSELIENTEKLVTEVNDKIKVDLASKGIDNSGEASNSIRIESSINSVTSLGVFYLEYLNRGRPPGKFPPVDIINKWVANKPVAINPYLVGRKIAREGTEIYKDNTKGIELSKKIQELKETLKQEAPKWAKEDVLVKLRGLNQNLNKFKL